MSRSDSGDDSHADANHKSWPYRLKILVLSLLVGFVLIATSIQSGAAVNYYVSPSGNDSNSGTSPERTWKTIDRVNIRTTGTVTVRPGSPLIDAGLDLRQSPFNLDVGTRDFYGNRVLHQKFDLGAHEYEPEQNCDSTAARVRAH